MNYPEKIDLHMHTNVSDGTDTPQELLEEVRNLGLDLFSVTDHDAIKSSKEIRQLLKKNDPWFITGVEFSCRDEEGQYHILGYGYDPDDAAICRLVDKGHAFRMNKVKARLDFITNEFGFVFSEEDIRELFAQDNPGKPHIANLMVRYGYANSKEEAIKDFINKIHFKSEYVRPEQAISAITESGGIPVLAHPSYGSGDQIIVGPDLEERIKRLMKYGLKGVEAFYSGFTLRLMNELLSYADKYRLLITAGSDYHGRNKLVELGDTNCVNASEGPEGLLAFIEEARKRQSAD